MICWTALTTLVRAVQEHASFTRMSTGSSFSRLRRADASPAIGGNSHAGVSDSGGQVRSSGVQSLLRSEHSARCRRPSSPTATPVWATRARSTARVTGCGPQLGMCCANLRRAQGFERASSIAPSIAGSTSLHLMTDARNVCSCVMSHSNASGHGSAFANPSGGEAFPSWKGRIDSSVGLSRPDDS